MSKPKNDEETIDLRVKKFYEALDQTRAAMHQLCRDADISKVTITISDRDFFSELKHYLCLTDSAIRTHLAYAKDTTTFHVRGFRIQYKPPQGRPI